MLIIEKCLRKILWGNTEEHAVGCGEDSATLCTVAHQAPLSMGFSRQEYWHGWPFTSPEDLPNPGIKSGSPVLQVDSLLTEPPEKPCDILELQLCLPLHSAVLLQSFNCYQLAIMSQCPRRKKMLGNKRTEVTVQ